MLKIKFLAEIFSELRIMPLKQIDKIDMPSESQLFASLEEIPA